MKRLNRLLPFVFRPPFDTTLNNSWVRFWQSLGRPTGIITFAPHRPTMGELRKLAHAMAEAHPHLSFCYGYDDEDDAYIEVL